MITINDIKNNKLVLRDCVALIKEIINSLETNNDNLSRISSKNISILTLQIL